MRTCIYYTMAFKSTHYAVAAEKYLSGIINVSVMPTLREHIRFLRNIPLRIEEEDLEKLKDALKMRPDIAENSSLYKADGENVSPIEYN